MERTSYSSCVTAVAPCTCDTADSRRAICSEMDGAPCKRAPAGVDRGQQE